MQGRDFYDRIIDDPRFEWLGSIEGATAADDEAVVACPGAGQFGFIFVVAIADIANHSWQEFVDLLTGKRQPKLMEWMTRIVGYYSDVTQWNRSKIAELHDRRKGDYGVAEAA